MIHSTLRAFIVFLTLFAVVQASAKVTRDTAPDPQRMRADTVIADGIVATLKVEGRSVTHSVTLPFAPESKINGTIEIPDGSRVEYEFEIEVPEGWPGGILYFEGVDYESEVFFNGTPLGKHRGAFDPFSFDVSKVLKRGKNKVVVRAQDSTTRRNVLVGKQERAANEGAIFYKNMTGIWKSVWIERVGETHIVKDSLVLQANGEGMLTLNARVQGSQTENARLRLRLKHPDEPANAIDVEIPVVAGAATMVGKLQNAKLWSTDEPNLYYGSVELVDAKGEVLDAVEVYTGFRTFAMKSGYFRENAEPYYLQGVLNQAIYPDTLYTPTDSHTLTDFQDTKAEGFNGERRHQTTPRYRDLWLADKLGYWLSIEMPSARDLTQKEDRDAALDEWKRIVRAYAFNHPSVYFLVAGNEDWGMLEHHHHWTSANDEMREEFQFELGRATEEAAPKDMLYAANDGWRVVTSLRYGEPVTVLDSTRLMFNIHDYGTLEELTNFYGVLPAFPVPGEWVAENRRNNLHSNGYQYDGVTPFVLSEFGGRALINRTAEGVMAYGEIHRDPQVWTTEVSVLLEGLGKIKALRGGYVYTQRRDAGNDPEDDRSLGELNGLSDAYGKQKSVGDAIRKGNLSARREWKKTYLENECAQAILR